MSDAKGVHILCIRSASDEVMRRSTWRLAILGFGSTDFWSVLYGISEGFVDADEALKGNGCSTS